MSLAVGRARLRPRLPGCRLSEARECGARAFGVLVIGRYRQMTMRAKQGCDTGKTAPICSIFAETPRRMPFSLCSGNRKQKYVEGWVEFADKRKAKRIALSLNNTPIGAPFSLCELPWQARAVFIDPSAVPSCLRPRCCTTLVMLHGL